jgi:hypothetical protein
MKNNKYKLLKPKINSTSCRVGRDTGTHKGEAKARELVMGSGEAREDSGEAR